MSWSNPVVFSPHVANLGRQWGGKRWGGGGHYIRSGQVGEQALKQRVAAPTTQRNSSTEWLQEALRPKHDVIKYTWPGFVLAVKGLMGHKMWFAGNIPFAQKAVPRSSSCLIKTSDVVQNSAIVWHEVPSGLQSCFHSFPLFDESVLPVCLMTKPKTNHSAALQA